MEQVNDCSDVLNHITWDSQGLAENVMRDVRMDLAVRTRGLKISTRISNTLFYLGWIIGLIGHLFGIKDVSGGG